VSPTDLGKSEEKIHAKAVLDFSTLLKFLKRAFQKDKA